MTWTPDELEFTVRVKPLVEDEDRDFDDQDLQEEYTICLPAQARDWTPGQQATRVLDEFHESVPVAVLDDFEFSVLDPEGNEIFEDDEDAPAADDGIDPPAPRA